MCSGKDAASSNSTRDMRPRWALRPLTPSAAMPSARATMLRTRASLAVPASTKSSTSAETETLEKERTGNHKCRQS